MDCHDFWRPRNHIAAAIYDRLVYEQAKRKERRDWQRDELDAYYDVICRERAKLGKGPVPMPLVERVERSAAGHVDYTTKLAHYGAELVWGE